MYVPNKRQIIEPLEAQGFESQVTPEGDAILTRPALIPELFERVEVVFVGRHHESLMADVSVSVVRFAVLQWRGLVVRRGLSDLDSSPETGYVHLDSRSEEAAWIARFAEVAPKRARECAEEEGPALLSATSDARMSAAAAFERVLAPTLETRDPVATLRGELSPREIQLAGWLIEKPLVRARRELEVHTRLAVAALIANRDAEVIAIAGKESPISTGPQDRIMMLKEAPRAVIRRIRIVVDLLLRHSSDTGLPALPSFVEHVP